MCFPCEATPRPTRANPAHPRGGGILSFAIAPHTIDALPSSRETRRVIKPECPPRWTSQTPVPPSRYLNRPGSVGALEDPPGRKQAPFRGHPNYAQQRPGGSPRTVLAARKVGAGRWPASRARHTDLSGQTRGILSNAKPRGASPNYGRFSIPRTMLSKSSRLFQRASYRRPRTSTLSKDFKLYG